MNKDQQESIESTGRFVLAAAVAIVIILILFIWKTIQGIVYRQSVLDSRLSKLDKLIDGKSKLARRIDRIVKWTRFVVRALMVGILVWLNYRIGYIELQFKVTDISDFLTLNAALALVLTLLSFVLYGNSQRLMKTLELTDDSLKKILVKFVLKKEKWATLENQVKGHKKEKKKVSAEKEANAAVLDVFNGLESDKTPKQ